LLTFIATSSAVDVVSPGIGASVGTPGEKKVLVWATTLPTRQMPAEMVLKEGMSEWGRQDVFQKSIGQNDHVQGLDLLIGIQWMNHQPLIDTKDARGSYRTECLVVCERLLDG
jgi:hypothetical protein